MSRSISDQVFDIGRDLQRAYDEGYKQGRKLEIASTDAPYVGKRYSPITNQKDSIVDAAERE